MTKSAVKGLDTIEDLMEKLGHPMMDFWWPVVQSAIGPRGSLVWSSRIEF